MRKKSSAWLVIICAVSGAVAVAIAQNKVLPCMDVIQDSFHIDMASAGWLSSVFSVMGIVMAFPAVMTVNKLGAKASCLISVGCSILGAVIGLISRSFLLILFSRVIEGVGAGLISIAVPNLIAMWFPPESRGLPTGIWTSWQYVGQSVCFFFGALISAETGWKGVWVFSLLIAAICFVLNVIFVRAPEHGENRAVDCSDSAFSAFGNKNAWLVSISIFCFCFASFGFITWAAACWTETLGMDGTRANHYISLFAAISLPMVLLTGWILDRVNRKIFGIIVFIFYAFAVAGAFVLPSPGWVVVFVMLYPFFESGVITALWTIISQVAGSSSEVNSAVALLTLSSNIGMLVGPPMAGLCISTFGWTAAALLVGGVSMAGAACIMLVKTDEHHPISSPTDDGAGIPRAAP
jgi:predicted MFS family arabinose efflux permease